jgi:purine-nucleoside/S-methyl-5'-thioadenosine phosphorylase / adenosine deaminase
VTSLPLIRWDTPGPYRVVFSTRVGGVSEGPFESLNLGRMTSDEPERVEENRRRLCAEVGANFARLTLNRQVHSATVHQATAGSRGVPGDGLWTDETDVPMLKIAADCLPIAVARTSGRAALVLLHAGWQGLLEGIVDAGVTVLGQGPLAAVVGPGIGPCCYEVREDVAGPYRAAFGRGIVNDGRLDMWAAAELALRRAGCDTVERTDLCTSCHPDLFFSHRRDGARTGRQGVLGLVG